MTFLIDENFPRSAADVLTAAGHEALFVDDVCEFGADDEEVFAAAQKRHAVIVTSDRDFYHTIPLLHPTHCGIIVISLRQPNRGSILARLKWFVENIPFPIENKAFAIRDKTYCRR